MDNAEECLLAILEGLEVENIDMLTNVGDHELFREIGKRIAKGVKNGKM